MDGVHQVLCRCSRAKDVVAGVAQGKQDSRSSLIGSLISGTRTRTLKNRNN